MAIWFKNRYNYIRITYEIGLLILTQHTFIRGLAFCIIYPWSSIFQLLYFLSCSTLILLGKDLNVTHCPWIKIKLNYYGMVKNCNFCICHFSTPSMPQIGKQILISAFVFSNSLANFQQRDYNAGPKPVITHALVGKNKVAWGFEAWRHELYGMMG